MRGKFTEADATAAGQTLAAYALGLLPFVLIRSVTAPFLARGDTATPVKASLTAVAVNVVCKILLMGPLAQVGLALATSIGAWLNLALVTWLAVRQRHLAFDAGLRSAMVKLAGAGSALALVLWLAQRPVANMFAGWATWRDESVLAVLAAIGGAVYFGIVVALFGRQWLAVLRARRRRPAAPVARPLTLDGSASD
jgi:putative peptidoglycan lipid II flippase